jgi:hypothetical protein
MIEPGIMPMVYFFVEYELKLCISSRNNSSTTKFKKEVARKGNSTLGLAKCRKLLSSYPATCALIISAF